MAISDARLPETDSFLDSYPLPDETREKVRIGLGELVNALRDEPLSENGRAMAVASLHDDLRRLKGIVDDRSRYPEIADVEIKQPLFILGLPRCGTSILHALMGAVPSIRTPMQWEVAFPSPPPAIATRDDAAFGEYLQGQLGSGLEDMMKAHPIGPLIPQECGSFMRTSFESSNPVMAFHVPRFYEWFKGISADFRYEVHKMWLQHLGWKTGREHWVLKIQEHMYKMPALRGVYPDAVFVQPHRDPTTVVASISQLILARRSPMFDRQDRRALGQEMLHLWHDGIACLMRYRQDYPDVPIYDISYRELVADPVATARRIHEKFGWEFTQEAASSIQNWLDENPADKHGKHKYTLEDFDLDKSEIRTTYAEYIDTYRDYL